MAYLLRFDGTNDYVTLGSTVGGAFADRLNTNQDWELEFQFARQGADSYVHRFFRDTVDADEVIWRNSDGLFRMALLAGSMTWTIAGISAGVVTTFKIVKVTGGNLFELFVNGVSQGTKNPGSGVTIFNFNQIGQSSSAGYINGDLYYVKYTTTNSGVSGYWNPSASNGTGSTLPDTVGSNDGTLVNFPVDDSQWVFYSTGVTGTASHQATTATHAATGIREITGSSSHQAATATQTASGTVGAVITGTAAHQAATAAHSATGERVVTGSATHQAATATHSATGERVVTGTASHQAATATHAATGTRTITSTSTHQAATATQSASGAVSGAISGTAAHQATTATHAATGLRIVTGTASHQAATATHSSTGQVGNVVTGSGSHQAATATHAATGLRVITGAGANTTTRATQAATGLRVITGTGYHQATTATQAASDQQPGLVTATATGRKSITNISDRYAITNISDRYSIAG